MTTLSKKQIAIFQQEILAWYAKNKRDLPWRQTRDPYAILVSEVMLQQTQVGRVIPKFLAWMERFPTIESLAKTSTRDVLSHWSGLGYNRRAVYLKEAASQLLAYNLSHRAKSKKSSRLRLSNNPSTSLREEIIWPQTEEQLRKLPGIGEYTARAILCFAFDKQIAVVDTNVRKVILVWFKRVILSSSKKDEGYKKVLYSSASLQNDKIIKTIANQLLPEKRAYEWNQALMDYASAELKKEKIPLKKQTPFKKSKRFYRGQVIKLLLEKNQTAGQLFAKIENNGIGEDTFGEILSDMEREKLIFRKNRQYTIPL